MCDRALLFRMSILVTSRFRGYQHYLHCDLELWAWPTILNFNLLNNFSTVSARALAFHSSISGDKIFFLKLRYLSSRPFMIIYGIGHYRGHLCFQTRLAFMHFVEVLNTSILPAYCLVQFGCLSTVWSPLKNGTLKVVICQWR